MEKDENPVNENCPFEEDAEHLLSEKVSQLNLTPFPTKFIAEIRGVNISQEQAQTNTTTELSHTSLATGGYGEKFTKEGKPKKKGKRQKDICTKKKDSYCLDDGKIFELSQTRHGRRPMMTEVKNARVRDFSGRGILVFPNRKKFEGEWVEGNLIGEARISYPNGDIYLGGTYNYQKHGKGYLYFATGEKYVGQFSSGDFHGQGIFYGAQGEVKYDGQWRRGKRHDR